MHSIFAALPARTLSRFPLALVTLLLLVAGLLPGCSNPHESPQILFAHVQELNLEGRSRAIWNLYTEKERSRQSGAWDSYREFLVRNPGQKNRDACLRRFGLEPEQLAGLSHVEIFEILNAGQEDAMVEARITDDEPASDLENGHRIYWVTAAGQKCVMLTQYVNDGWYLVTLRE
jgi:hypothetical protein